MTQNRRIVLNIVATYGRSLYALVIGLFCGRWALLALGEVDYGLMGVVGGLVVFISFINGLLASAVGRFYAYTMGQVASSRREEGLDLMRMWFSLAVTIHTVIPIVLMAFGFPLGQWVVKNFLVVPVDRVETCMWVFRFVCISCFVAMITVPVNAMYVAKQYIAELTVYSFVTSTLNVVFLYYMLTHPDVWLLRYAFWTCLLSIAPNIIIGLRGIVLFPECKFRMRYAWDRCRFRQLLSYCGWTFVGGLGMVLRNQGIAVLVNKFYGPSTNASMSIATTVNGHSTTLVSAVQGAMTPVITSAIGAGNLEYAKVLSFRFCKFALMATLLFVIPLSLELPEVMRLWLKNPPASVTGLCFIMLMITVVDSQTHGHGIAIMAYGKIKWYQIILGGFNLLTLPLACLFCFCGGTVHYVALSCLITWTLLAYGRLYFAKVYLRMGVGDWLIRIIFPIMLVAAVTVSIASIPQFYMEASFVRVCVTTCIAAFIFLCSCWKFALDREEKDFVMLKIQKWRMSHG